MKATKYLGSLYFAAYAAIGAVLPFLSIYYHGLGLNGSQISALIALHPLADLFLAPLWGGGADRTGRHRNFLLLALTGASVAAFGFSFGRTFPALFLAAASFAGFSTAIIPLLDTIAVQILNDKVRNYGQIRLWGSAGSASFVIAVGFLNDRLGFHLMFAAYICLALLGIAIAFHLPHRSTTLQHTSLQLHQVLGATLAIRKFRSLLVGLTFAGIAAGAGEAFLGILIADVGGTSLHVGLAFALQAIVEIPAMGLTRQVLQRVTPRALFTWSFVGLTGILAMQSWIPLLSVILLAQPLWGAAWVGYWTGSRIEIAEIVPSQIQASAQTLAASVSLGFGSLLGAVLSAVLLEPLGVVTLYRVFTGLSVLGILVFLIYEWRLATRLGVVGSNAKK